MVFGSGPLEGAFAEVSLCNVSRVESAGFKSFFFALAVSLATLRIFDENGHKSGRQTCSFFWPCPSVKLARFAPAAEKTEKTEKTGSTIFVQNPLFFVQNSPAPSPKNFRSKPQNFRSKPQNFRSKPRLRGVFACSTAIPHKMPETHSRPPPNTEELGWTN